jgi:integrase
VDYLDGRITTEEFINMRNSKATKDIVRWSLNLFDYFIKDIFDGNSGEKVVLDIEKEILKDGKTDRIFRLTNQFIEWLKVDHKNIIVRSSNHDVFITKHTASSIHVVVSHVRAYYEEFGQIDFPDRKFRRMVKLPKKIKFELYALTKDEIKQMCNRSSTHRKVLYMILKDTGLRISEALLIKKRDFTLVNEPISLNIPPNHDKTNSTNQTRYLTSETKEFLESFIQDKADDDYLFIKNYEHLEQAVNNEERIFDLLRKKLGFTERYEHNNRHKIVIHSFRAFCATTLADKYGEEFAHGYIGHSKYLGQYIRNKKKVPEMFKRIENELMIYKTVEVIDDSERVRELEIKMDRQQHNVTELTKLMKELSEQKEILAAQKLEIQKLKNTT